MEISTSSLAVYDDGLPEGTPIAFEIVGSRLEDPVRGLTYIGHKAPLDLPEGIYQVRITHPELGRLEQTLRLGQDARLVSFGNPPAPQPSPAPDSPHLGPDRKGSSPSRPLPRLRDKNRREAGFERAAGTDAWMAWWQRAPDGSWIRCSDVAAFRCQAGYIQLREFGERYGVVLQIGANGRNACVQVPPMADRLYLNIDGDEVRARFRTGNRQAETLLDYLGAGYVDPAKTVRESSRAEELLEAKLANPAGAAVGAYFLLRIGEVQDLLPWLHNLASLFPLLPDGAVAYAWALLSANAESRLTEARSFLLQAAAHGLPVYSEGARLLCEGLMAVAANGDHDEDDMFPGSGARLPSKDRDATEALERLRPYFRAQRHGELQTSWRCGQSPEPVARSARNPDLRPPHASPLAGLPWAS